MGISDWFFKKRFGCPFVLAIGREGEKCSFFLKNQDIIPNGPCTDVKNICSFFVRKGTDMHLPRHEAKLHLFLFHQAIAEAAKMPTEERCNKRLFVHDEKSGGMPGRSKTAQLPKHLLGCSGKIKYRGFIQGLKKY